VLEALWMFLILVDEFVIRLRGSDPVKVDRLKLVLGSHLFAFFWLRITAVEKAFVATPGNARRFQPLNFVWPGLSRGHFHHVNLAPVRASLRDSIREVLS